jgi:conjugative transfer region protein TrbK
LWRETPHERHDVVGLLLRAATLALVAAAMALAVNQLRHDDNDNAVLPAAVLVDPLAAELARCRTITPEQNAADDTCRRAWAESRRRFFAPSLSRPDTVTKDPTGAQPDRDEVR